jgi:hypothetical protein
MASTRPERRVHLSVQQVLLAERLQQHQDYPQKMWDLLRAVGCWIIWKDRCNLVMQKRGFITRGQSGAFGTGFELISG